MGQEKLAGRGMITHHCKERVKYADCSSFIGDGVTASKTLASFVFSVAPYIDIVAVLQVTWGK